MRIDSDFIYSENKTDCFGHRTDAAVTQATPSALQSKVTGSLGNTVGVLLLKEESSGVSLKSVEHIQLPFTCM